MADASSYENPDQGRSWCIVCRQGYPASRIKTHVASKKHSKNLAKAPPAAASPGLTAKPAAAPPAAAPPAAALPGLTAKLAAAPPAAAPPAAAPPAPPAAAPPAAAPPAAAPPAAAPPAATPPKLARASELRSFKQPAAAPLLGFSPGELSGDSGKAKKTPPPRSKKGPGLPADPNCPGRFWCGICETFLVAKKAECHLDTARHRAKEKKTLVAAMQGVRIGGR